MSSAESIAFARAAAENAAPAAVPVARADQVAAAARDWQLDLVSDVTALADLGPDWNDLFERAGMPHHVFQTFGFVSLWTATFLADASKSHNGDADTAGCDGQLAIVTARSNGRLVLVWPLVIQRKWGVSIVSWLGEPMAQYADLLIDPGEPGLPLMQAAYDHVRRMLAPDVLRLRRVRDDAAILPLMKLMGAGALEPAEAPFVTLGCLAQGIRFEDRQSGKAKKNRRRLQRRLEERGTLRFEQSSGSDAAVALVDVALATKRDWLERRGLLSPAVANPGFDAFMRAAAAGDTTGCRVFSLSLDERPVAVAVGFVVKDRLMLHLITHAEDVEKCGAGILNLEAILRWAEASGLAAVDLQPPTADYKLQWADGAMPVADYTISPTLLGRSWAGMLGGVLRPLIKRTLDRIPLTLRRRLAHHQFSGAQS